MKLRPYISKLIESYEKSAGVPTLLLKGECKCGGVNVVTLTFEVTEDTLRRIWDSGEIYGIIRERLRCPKCNRLLARVSEALYLCFADMTVKDGRVQEVVIGIYTAAEKTEMYVKEKNKKVFKPEKFTSRFTIDLQKINGMLRDEEMAYG